MKEQDIQELKKLLAARKKIVLFPHKNPDGDALGSCLALYHFLIPQHEVKIISPNDSPDFLKWMPGIQNIHIFEKDDKSKLESFITHSDLIFIIDFNALHRLDELCETVKESSGLKVMIDHHEQPDTFDIMYSCPTASSTAEMVYKFLKKMEGEKAFSSEIATCLYTGIMTDTGAFRYPSTSAETHRVIAHLIELGADKAEIHGNVYDNNFISRLKLMGKALNNLVVLPEYNTSYSSLSLDELQSCNYKKGDTEGIVNYGLSLKGIILTAIFIEDKKAGIIKISFRSKGKFDVNQFARTYFDGGGHLNAAGGKSRLSLHETIENFKKIIIVYKEELNKN